MKPVTDGSIERGVSALLKAGVLLSGLIVLVGGMVYLIRHGGEPVDYRTFHGQPASDRLIPAILRGALRGQGRSIIQLGILVLIATPVARVAFSLCGFVLERDRTFVVITACVLVILLYSLTHGFAG